MPGATSSVLCLFWGFLFRWSSHRYTCARWSNRQCWDIGSSHRCHRFVQGIVREMGMDDWSSVAWQHKLAGAAQGELRSMGIAARRGGIMMFLGNRFTGNRFTCSNKKLFSMFLKRFVFPSAFLEPSSCEKTLVRTWTLQVRVL